ncbi:hypothetical protein LguiA_031470 [Lonicera macranthoides]
MVSFQFGEGRRLVVGKTLFRRVVLELPAECYRCRRFVVDSMKKIGESDINREKGKMWNVVDGFKPTMIMVLVQTIFAGANVFYKLVDNDGMNLKILMAYRLLFASAFMIPLALYVERLEEFGWRTATGKAKVMGTLVALGGAMILTFYKGPQINMSTNVNLVHTSQAPGPVAAPAHKSGQMILGSLLSLGCCISYALWLILQAKMAERYPCPYSATALTVFFGSFQGAIFAICTQSSWSQWKLGWNIGLLTIAYTGIVASGLMFTMVAWCVRKRGPLFVSVFNPLGLVLVTLVGSLLLDENLYLGSIVGAVLIVCGLYLVLWGKSKEMKRNSGNGSSSD